MIYLYVFCILVLVLSGVYAWPCLEIPDYAYIFIYFITFISGFIVSGRIKRITNGTKFFVLVLLIGCVILAKGINGTIIKSILFGLTILQILTCNKHLVNNVLKLLNKIFFAIISVSTGLFILQTLGLPMPSLGVIKYYQYILDNHVFFVSNLDNPSIRFHGFCVEPGYFALLLSCLICINEYKINKYNIVYIIALLLTLSLGGLFITSFGWFLHYTLSKSLDTITIIRKSFLFVFIGIIAVFLLSHLGGGIGEAFTDNILGRLAFDSEKGFVGNNRMNERFDLFWYSFLLSDQVLWGMGSVEYFSSIEGLDLDAASYRVFVMQYGVIYTVLFLVAVFVLCKSIGNKKYILPVVSLYLMDFLQHGTPFQGVFLIVFILMSRYQNVSIGLKNETKLSSANYIIKE